MNELSLISPIATDWQDRKPATFLDCYGSGLWPAVIRADVPDAYVMGIGIPPKVESFYNYAHGSTVEQWLKAKHKDRFGVILLREPVSLEVIEGLRVHLTGNGALYLILSAESELAHLETLKSFGFAILQNGKKGDKWGQQIIVGKLVNPNTSA